jgi:fibronectin type 3 domain-containing protein
MSVTLAWDASTDNSGSFSYSLNKDGQGFTVPQSRTTYAIDWLSAGQTYTFYVTAVDAALNTSGRSNTVTVTTPGRQRLRPRHSSGGACAARRRSR